MVYQKKRHLLPHELLAETLKDRGLPAKIQTPAERFRRLQQQEPRRLDASAVRLKMLEEGIAALRVSSGTIQAQTSDSAERTEEPDQQA